MVVIVFGVAMLTQYFSNSKLKGDLSIVSRVAASFRFAIQAIGQIRVNFCAQPAN
jgi:hypothetical protein